MASIEQLKYIIREWQDREYKDLVHREIDVPLDTGKIIALVGPRRCGKTYVLHELKSRLVKKGQKAREVLYLSFEDERLALDQQELDLILQAYFELYPDVDRDRVCFLFDEIQNIPGWERFIRRIYDTISRNIFLTGSNAKMLSQEIASALRGRNLTFELWPLSFNEYLAFNKITNDIYDPVNRYKIKNALDGYLKWGGFPEIARLNDDLKTKTLQDYFDVMIYRDIIERYEASNPTLLKFFLKRTIYTVGGPLSINKIYHELKSQGYKISKDYLYEYQEMGEAIFLLMTCYKFDPSVIKRTYGEKKTYTVDNGFLNALTFKFSGDYSTLLENLVYVELRRRGEMPYFYKSKHECDFVTFEKDTVKGLYQVAYDLSDEETFKREEKGLVEACKALGKKEGTIISYTDESDEWEEDGIKITIQPALQFFLN